MFFCAICGKADEQYFLSGVGYFCDDCYDLGEYSGKIMGLVMSASMAAFGFDKKEEKRLADLRDEEVPKILEEWKNKYEENNPH